MKPCSKCQVVKPLDEFYKHPHTRDGRGSWCRACEKSRDRSSYTSRYRGTAEYVKAQALYRASSKSRDTNRAYLRASRGPRVIARETLNAAIRRGRIDRPAGCQNCGLSCVPHGHHDDYSKPLDVRWLCPKCHTAAHGRTSPALGITYTERGGSRAKEA